ncbi:MAG: CHRD domain-containing protein [Balneolales bacterium]
MKLRGIKSIISAIAVFMFFSALSLTATAQTVYKARLSGSHEVPPVTTTGTGEITATLDGTTLTVEGSVANLSAPVATEIGGGAHIHMALPGRNGGVVFPLTIDLDPDELSGTINAVDNEFELNTDQWEALGSRMLYVNVHTDNFTGGEIRGQLMPESDAYFRANLSGTTVMPSRLSQANGAIIGELDGDTLTVTGSFQDLSDDLTNQHIHLEIAGRSGGVAFPLAVDVGEDNRSGVFSPGDNSFTLDPGQKDALLERRYYVNVHSAAYPGGEIRGQIVPQVTSTMVAKLSGGAVTAGVMSDGSGSIIAELNEDTLVVTGSFSGLGSDYTNSHLHLSIPGRNGGVSVGLVPTIDPEDGTQGIYEAEDNTFVLDEDQITQLLTRNLYINVHSADNPGGEIRGQLLGESYAFFTSRFGGINVVDPVESSGTGGVEIEFKGNRLVMVGAYDNLSSAATNAHFHIGAPDEGGGVILGVNRTPGDPATSGTFQLEDNHFMAGIDEDFVGHLFNETLYLNIHTENYPGGEIRGQVLAAPNAWPEASELEMPEDDAYVVIEGDTSQTLDFSWTEAVDPDGNTVVYLWQMASDDQFSDLIMNSNEGTETSMSPSYADVDEFLAEQGVDPGETLTLYHRILTSDGNLQQAGASRSFTLERGFVTGIDHPGDGVYKARLSGSHEVPPVTTTGTGEITATLDGTTLTVEGSVANLSAPVATEIGGGAHIHMALPGRNGGVVFPLTIDLDPDELSGTINAVDNEFELNTDQWEALGSRMLYVNVHTDNFTGGEIRGQLMPESDAYFRANLSGTTVMPSRLSQANGAIIGELDGDTLTVTGSFQDLSDDLTNQHIHLEIAGRSGGVAFPLAVDVGEDNRSGVFSPGDNSFTLDPGQKDALLERRYYVNVHSAAYPGGEIRGQIVPQVTSTMVAKLSGGAVTAGVMSDGSGSIIAELNEDTLVVTGSFSGLGSDYTNSHLHLSIPGRNGGVSVGLVPTIDPEDGTQGIYEAEDNTFVLDEDQITQLLTRNLYINVHSADNPGGEIRGQLLGESYAFFTSRFGGINVVDPVESSGTGGVEIEFKGNRLVMVGAYDNLSSAATNAHFHIGAPDEGGGVILGVNRTPGDPATSGTFQLEDNHFMAGIDEDFVGHLFNETLYLNIHTENYPGGEIRGQVLAAPNAWPEASELEMPEDDAYVVIEGDTSQTLDFSWTEAVDPDGNTVVYLWQMASDDQFSDLIMNSNEGTETSMSPSYADVDEFLAEQGVDPGETLTLYHRILTSDGNLQQAGASRSFTLERGLVTGIDQPGAEVPLETRLEQNYPNPFNPTTEISFAVKDAGPVELEVYNMIGQRVAVLISGDLTPGEYTVNFDASDISSGIYIYRLKTNGNLISRKMTLVK